MDKDNTSGVLRASLDAEPSAMTSCMYDEHRSIYRKKVRLSSSVSSPHHTNILGDSSRADDAPWSLMALETLFPPHTSEHFQNCSTAGIQARAAESGSVSQLAESGGAGVSHTGTCEALQLHLKLPDPLSLAMATCSPLPAPRICMDDVVPAPLFTGVWGCPGVRSRSRGIAHGTLDTARDTLDTHLTPRSRARSPLHPTQLIQEEVHEPQAPRRPQPLARPTLRSLDLTSPRYVFSHIQCHREPAVRRVLDVDAAAEGAAPCHDTTMLAHAATLDVISHCLLPEGAAHNACGTGDDGGEVDELQGLQQLVRQLRAEVAETQDRHRSAVDMLLAEQQRSHEVAHTMLRLREQLAYAIRDLNHQIELVEAAEERVRAAEERAAMADAEAAEQKACAAIAEAKTAAVEQRVGDLEKQLAATEARAAEAAQQRDELKVACEQLSMQQRVSAVESGGRGAGVAARPGDVSGFSAEQLVACVQDLNEDVRSLQLENKELQEQVDELHDDRERLEQEKSLLRHEKERLERDKCLLRQDKERAHLQASQLRQALRNEYHLRDHVSDQLREAEERRVLLENLLAQQRQQLVVLHGAPEAAMEPEDARAGPHEVGELQPAVLDFNEHAMAVATPTPEIV